ncbi:uncharacterized protein [Apostichopus japonicus]|uniref:uncharacterized protein n=1 Tax=Stichopus japonicus TaxID=307972 RepID=UPI003AB4F3DD
MAVLLKAINYGGLFIFLMYVSINAEYPPSGFPLFYVISHYPETGRSAPIYVYASTRFYIGDSDSVDISITKDGGLPTNALQTGSIIDNGGYFYGCFLRVDELNRRRGMRYGQYRGHLNLADGLSEFTGYTFVKPKSAVLDTRGVRTVTIYPKSTTSSDLKKEVSIGVRWSPGCRKIFWSKGKARDINTGPRLILKTTDDAGLYTIQRPRRAGRGFFVQILVIAATCPANYYYDTGTEKCIDSGIECHNGGVLSDNFDVCICPPFLFGELCDCAIDYDGEQLYLSYDEELPCEDLPGGDPKCKGNLVCYGDNYGCKCSSGWWGNACDRACPKGKWGASCEQKCPDNESDCNRFYGPSSNLGKNGCGST